MAIFVNGAKVTSKVVDGWFSVIPLPHLLAVGDQVTATQETRQRREPSVRDAHNRQSSRRVLPASPSRTSYACGRASGWKGPKPGAEITVAQNGTTIANDATVNGQAWINLNQGLALGSPIIVSRRLAVQAFRQTNEPAGRSASQPVARSCLSNTAFPLPTDLSAAWGIINGANVRVAINDLPDGEWTVPIEAFDYPLSKELKQGIKSASTQSLPGCVVNDHSVATSSGSTQLSAAASDMPTPYIKARSATAPQC